LTGGGFAQDQALALEVKTCVIPVEAVFADPGPGHPKHYARIARAWGILDRHLAFVDKVRYT